ncbi:pre-peptidase C-terminal domain-containing protein [Hahella sp. HN01]|uniref:pre-peptidase C-terminal domain-containing protein n=1 Tax=Hahella sp. HN01 TaxID=2847262 RepID=UPI001C1EE70E|nr:pre-peptidase C-terminal domain-containing protein [Hahella sp. HN01]MBU6954997.1 pre-peptidase C-terminal domain-containing protein [Hahella sp. HN01]
MKKSIGTIFVCALSALPLLAHSDDSRDIISDEQFIYSYQEMLTFDVAAYLKRNAPHLLDQTEVITHWAGYSTVSPKVLLTLIEMQTGLVSGARTASLQRPLGDLSERDGFSAQVEDIAMRLAKAYYSTVNQEQKSLSVSGEDIATRALSRALMNNAAGDAEEFATVYQRLFPQEQESAEPPGVSRFSAYSKKLVPPENMLQLPFPIDQSWWFGGAHTNTGSGNYPLSSLDMNNGGGWGSDTSTKWAVASAAGTAVRHSSCFVEVLHDGGWSTTYYHLDNVQFQDRTAVSQNQKLANYANNRSQALCNGGSSTGPHQHFSLKYDGGFYHLDGVYLSGYKVKTGRYSYDGDCNYFWMSKNGSKYCTSNKLYNPGTSGPTDPDTPDKELENGQVLSNLSADKEDKDYYVLKVDPGASDLVFRISGGSGDMDMFVKFGERPTLASYDCRPYKTTQEEICTFNSPQAGNYYVMLHAFSSYSGITFEAGYKANSDSSQELMNGEAVTKLSGSKDEMDYFYVDIPESARNLRIEMSGGQGDADMHVRFRTPPTLNEYDCRPFKTTQVETCSYNTPQTGVYHVMLHAFDPYSDVQLVARYDDRIQGKEVAVVLTQARQE